MYFPHEVLTFSKLFGETKISNPKSEVFHRFPARSLNLRKMFFPQGFLTFSKQFGETKISNPKNELFHRFPAKLLILEKCYFHTDFDVFQTVWRNKNFQPKK